MNGTAPRGMTTCVGTRELRSRPNQARAQAAARLSKSQFVVVSTTLQGSADAATGSAGAARAVVAGLHLGSGAKTLPCEPAAALRQELVVVVHAASLLLLPAY